MKEECLITNIYVPDTEDKNLPVIVNVHGGGFEIGYGNMVMPKYLVRSKKVIVVNFNYRLGVHGFLCLGSKDAPGNAGLKDQVALLRWVKKNIANFGGNPDDVTITGGSAGSISVHLLMLSKAAEGLFTKVIPESGANVGAVSVQADPLKNAKTYAGMLNFTDVDDFYALEEFYKNAPLKSLFMSTFLDRKDASLLFAPCVERKTGEERVLVDAPVNIIQNGKHKKVPILIGTSNMEGLIQIMNLEKWKDAMNENFSDFLPGDLQFESEEEKKEVGQKVKEFYFGDQPIGEETVLPYVEYFGDVTFGYPTYRSVKLQVEAGHDQIYLYEYSFVDERTPVVPHTNVKGATHCAQTTAMLDGVSFDNADESSLSEEYKQMKSILREIWINFVLHGKPVLEGSSLPAWPAAGADGSPHMSLGQEVKLRGAYLEKRVKFWDGIYEKYYRLPVAPPEPPQRHVEL
nr:detoxification protein CXE28 [Mythimna separata]